MVLSPPLAEILELARWAPSGDNSQCWRFGIQGDDHVVVYGHDDRHECVCDVMGRPSQVSLGTMLETMRIAATVHGWSTRIELREGSHEERPVFDVVFDRSAGVEVDPLASVIRTRSVQRRPLSTRPLTAAEMTALEDAAAPGYRLEWYSSARNRRRFAALLERNGLLRLSIPEAYEVHKSIIEWGATTSEDRVPALALGVGNAELAIMRWSMNSWQRVQFLSRYLNGTLLPRLRMDWYPALRCAAHYTLRAATPPSTVDDYVAAGRAVQRVWLTATALGLVQQPEMMPVFFSASVRSGATLTRSRRGMIRARRLEHQVRDALGENYVDVVWMARIGSGPAVTARSTRLPLSTLIVEHPAAEGAPELG